MVLVIDTSSARSAVALIRDGAVVAEESFESGRDSELGRRVLALGQGQEVAKVLVATGPGSFTGLRLGVSYGIGFALGRELPLLGLSGLEIQARRGRGPLTGLAEAGRGRVYWLAPDLDAPRHGEPAELPRQWPAAGWLRPETVAAVRASGVDLLPESELDTFGAAALRALPGARRLAYGSVRLEYMHSPAALRRDP